MQATMLVKGLLSWVPGVRRAFYDRQAAKGTDSASYCYGVWIKHLTLLRAHGMPTLPRFVVEFGPGASIGTGVAALLSGSERYLAIDEVAHMRPDLNAGLFHQLVGLFAARAPRPKPGFPPIEGYLDPRLFPSAILDDARLATALAPRRLERIEDAVRKVGTTDADEMLRYQTWRAPERVPVRSADLLFSHVVLNHVTDLDLAYANAARIVAPGGWMSHHVDFSCLNTAREWNGHLAYGDLAWKVIKGKRPYFVSREPLARHLALLDQHGFDVMHLIRARREGGIKRSQLAPRWRGISDEDLSTQTGFIISRRR